MNIALIGEYSGFHTNLKDGLNELGHNAILVSDGDGFKKIHSDINLNSSSNNKFLKGFKYLRDSNIIPTKIKNYDVVQFINPIIPPYLELTINKNFIRNLINNNKSSYLVCAGDDGVIWDYWENKSLEKLRYSWIEGSKKHYYSENSLPFWDNKKILKWNIEIAENVNGIIPIMYEYFKPYEKYKKQRLIPIPININRILWKEPKVGNKIKIFHGLNRYFAKGTNYVEEAFDILKDKYPNDLELIIAGKLSINEYYNLIDTSNIIIDQVLSYSMGMNALNSLAMGKIVMGGNEPESSQLFGYKNCPAINIIPDPSQIVNQVEQILDNKNKILDLAYAGRTFIEEYHNYINIAKKYINFWNSKT